MNLHTVCGMNLHTVCCMKSGMIPILGRALTLRKKMYCQVCTNEEKAASLTFPGTNRIKKYVLEDHSKSRKHIEAVQDAKMRNVTVKAVLKEVFPSTSLQLASQLLWDFYFPYLNC